VLNRVHRKKIQKSPCYNLFDRLLDVLHSSEDPSLLRLMVERGEALLYTLRVIEGECSRPFIRSVL
jgi:hypothetical protein